MIASDLAQSHIHRLDGIGGVDRFADISRKSAKSQQLRHLIRSNFGT
jgi:hypothetical protein